MYIKPVTFFAFLGVASGYGFNTECGPMDSHMFEALGALGKTPVQLRFPKSIPYPHLPAGKDQIPEIKHVLWLMMENHSWDHIYGLLNRTGNDGFPLDNHGKPNTLVPQRYSNGSTQLLYEMPSSCAGASNGPSQNWQSSHQQLNNGSMDGWAIGGEQDKPVAMGYLTRKHLPFLHSLGETFAINDRFFASCLGQTWPNRMYALGASSRGIIATGQSDDLSKVMYPNGLIFDTLDMHDVSWTNYMNGTNASVESTLRLFPNNNYPKNKFRTFPDDFMSDVKEGKLSQFSFLDFNSSASMEYPKNVVLGDQVMYDVVTALMASPKWNSTLLVINFDEHGGLYDHVHPSPAIAPDDVAPIIPQNDIGFWQYSQYRRTGFRVPMIIVSPYAKQDYISHVVHDHTSVLAFLEHKFNLPALSCRDANANNLFDLIDFEALARKSPNFPNLHSVHLDPPSTDPDFLSCTTLNPGVIPAKGSVIPASGNATGPNFDPKCELF